jgi:hypothetical protein
MKLYSLLIAFLFVFVAFGQDTQRRIGEIEFYGRAGLDLNKIQAALPIHEGDAFTPSPDVILNTVNRVNEAVRHVTGRAATDVAPVCCDAQGNWILYIGLPGNSIRSFRYNPTPRRALRLPPEVVELYQQTMDALSAAVQHRGGEEDRSRGYMLSSDPTLHPKQLATREYAVRHEHLLRRVLEQSRDDEQRIVAAHFLGYARQSQEQIAALMRASCDANETVRNNATRALGVLAESNPRVAERIPATGFIEMLNSGLWTDRNKAGFVLEMLSRRREQRLLNELRSQAQDSLLEMARWRTGHAYSARVLLGRIAGIEESRLQQLVASGRVDEIINAVHGKR